ncbi:MAG: biotin synthase BioB [Deltaproteobacteria bacterium HGW-Deltaproteobacteria-6]|nr:MAG: biotin synthase BioB [Deltaproteobacteria bacterium HGW-Deltaproteobacteria-6]
MFWFQRAQRILHGDLSSKDEALDLLMSADDDLLGVLAAAFLIRRHYFGRNVTIHIIKNAKSGLCTEDCAFCSQAGGANTDSPQYALQKVEELVEGARDAHRMKAMRYCIVTSGRAPDPEDLEIICAAARQIKKEVPIQICASLGILTVGQSLKLKNAGVDRFNHNLESSERFYPSICTTHSFADRKRTAEIVKASGMELCSGGLIGMGETLADRVEMAFALREVEVDSIPLNFLDPRPGTALENLARLTPADCLRTLAMFRFVHPDKEIRVAGGREACLGSMQALSLYAANSIFTKGYLTTPGQGYEEDMEMIAQAGFHVTDWTAA